MKVRFALKSGEVRHFQMSAHTIELEGMMCLISILRDVTERRALEEQLRQAQKMEAVGRLAGGVAHDFNNLLVGILAYSELLKKKVPPGDLQRMTEEINSAAIRARDLTSRLLALSRRQVLQPRVLDFNALVRQTASCDWRRYSRGDESRPGCGISEGRSGTTGAGGIESCIECA